jgi:hypothetical protein
VKTDPLLWLQTWYASQCDGDWEHSFGLEISTLDNPGWKVCICLDDTELEGRNFERVETRRNDADWFSCCVGVGELNRQTSNAMFQAFCGPNNLTEVLEIFRIWAA